MLITGALQTGKTFSIRQFGKARFKSFIEINFIESPNAVEIFTNAKDSRDILLRISVFTQTQLTKNETLIFFDEVQKCPEIVTAIKFLVDESSYRYVLSGSLLGVELKNIRSVPVGYMDIKEMFPLDFEEFIMALGISDEIISTLQKSYQEHIAVDEFIHKKMIEMNGNTLPIAIEVKSGKDYEYHKVLSNVMDCSEYNIPFALVFSNNNLKVQSKTIYLPIYMLMFLQKINDIPILYKIDFDGLS